MTAMDIPGIRTKQQLADLLGKGYHLHHYAYAMLDEWWLVKPQVQERSYMYRPEIDDLFHVRATWAKEWVKCGRVERIGERQWPSDFDVYTLVKEG